MGTRRYLTDKYACFDCRKVFARPRNMIPYKLNPPIRQHGHLVRWLYFPQLTATCPNCGGARYLMGTKFKAPPQRKVKAWAAWRQDAMKRYLEWMKRVAQRNDPALTAQVDPYFSHLKP
ncbi:MAG: hypothetical protein SGI73_06225 [Chloroflexota bacterium]|nr:hypothetical protein [Chloroflexota bacterium]